MGFSLGETEGDVLGVAVVGSGVDTIAAVSLDGHGVGFLDGALVAGSFTVIVMVAVSQHSSASSQIV